MTSKHNMFPGFSPAYQIGSRLPSLQMNPTASLYAFFRSRLCVQVIEDWSSFHNDNYSNSGDGDGDDSGDCQILPKCRCWWWSMKTVSDDHDVLWRPLSSWTLVVFQFSMVLVNPSRLLLANLGRQDPGDSREVRYKGGRLEVSAKLRFRGVSWSQPVVYVCSLMYVFFQPWRLRVLF